MKDPTVFINGKPAAHSKCSGTSTTIDICNTPSPSGSTPIPYSSTASTDDVDPATCPGDVFIEGGVPLVMGSKITQTKGAKAGKGGGVISGTTGGEAELLTYSFNVLINFKPVGRDGDLMFHNKMNAVSPKLSIKGEPPKMEKLGRKVTVKG